MTDIGDWDVGGDQADGASAGAPVIDGGLLDSRTFPSPWPPAAPDQPQAAPPSPDLDVHAQVLQDISDAQAKLPPVQAPENPIKAAFGKGYSILQSEGVDPARLSDVTSTPTADMVALGNAGRRLVGVTDNGPEKMTYMVPWSFPVPPTAADVDPSTGLASTLRTQPFLFMPSPGPVKTGSGTTKSGKTFDTATMTPPADALAVDHGHRDIISDGFVDEPTPDQNPYGDTRSLSRQNPIPTATVSEAHVGWHVLDKGRLKFIYPTGSMTPDQIDLMQRNLNNEQNKFLRPK